MEFQPTTPFGELVFRTSALSTSATLPNSKLSFQNLLMPIFLSLLLPLGCKNSYHTLGFYFPFFFRSYPNISHFAFHTPPNMGLDLGFEPRTSALRRARSTIRASPAKLEQGEGLEPPRAFAVALQMRCCRH